MKKNTFGVQNIGIGSYALSSSLQSERTIGIEYEALKNNLNNDNLALGAEALKENTDGGENIGIGSFALNMNLKGKNNIGIGMKALQNNGKENTNRIGRGGGHSGTPSQYDGHANVSIGQESMQYNELGKYNVALGYQALNKNLDGDKNVTGFHALFQTDTTPHTTGSGYTPSNYPQSNIAIGYQAHFEGFSAANNIAIGEQSLYHNRTGTNNIGIGKDSCKGIPTPTSW